MEEYQENSSPEEKPTKGKKSKNPRRFSDDQIRSLESIFKVDTKLEARKKAEVAKDVGLQPRQVAIWFQNKRARWKSRQIEQDYKLLRAEYHTLNIQFQELKREKHSLQSQLDEVHGLIKKLDDKNGMGKGVGYAEENGSWSNVVGTKGENEKQSIRWDEEEEEEEEEEISRMSLAEPWCNLGLFDQPMSAISVSDWWDA